MKNVDGVRTRVKEGDTPLIRRNCLEKYGWKSASFCSNMVFLWIRISRNMEYCLRCFLYNEHKTFGSIVNTRTMRLFCHQDLYCRKCFKGKKLILFVLCFVIESAMLLLLNYKLQGIYKLRIPKKELLVQITYFLVSYVCKTSDPKFHTRRYIDQIILHLYK